MVMILFFREQLFTKANANPIQARRIKAQNMKSLGIA
jgi:hypothetical protein